MEVKHYNAIAKIIGGNLFGDNKLGMLVNSLSKYFEEEDESFNKHDFRAACLNGHNMVESDDVIHTYPETEIAPTIVEKTPYTWKPKESSVSEQLDREWKDAMKRMSKVVGKNFKDNRGKWRFTTKR